jgi:hypothetical protein
MGEAALLSERTKNVKDFRKILGLQAVASY